MKLCLKTLIKYVQMEREEVLIGIGVYSMY